MSDEVNIEFESEEEDDFLNRIEDNEESSTPRPQSADIKEDTNVDPNAPAFTGKKGKKKKALTPEQEVNKANRAANRRRREQVADSKRNTKEQQQDNTSARKAYARDQKQISRDAVVQARSNAISQRVQAYSLAASIGLPGYIGASIVDALYIRPRSEQQVAEQEQYQEQLRAYNEGLARDELLAKREQERQIRETPVQATQIDPQTGRPIPPSGNPPGPPPTTPPSPPPNTPPSNTPTGNASPQTQPGNTPPQGPPQGPPGQPPAGQPGPIPPRIPPTPPNAPPGINPLVSTLGTGAIVLTALVQGMKLIDNTTAKLGNTVSSVGGALAQTNGSTGAQTLLKSTKPLAMLGMGGVVGAVTVEGFSALLSINQGILDSIKESIAFSPQTLEATVEGDLAKLTRQIEAGQRLDSVTAELVRMNTSLDAAWSELRIAFIQEFGPIIIIALKSLAENIELLTAILPFLSDLAQMLGMFGGFMPSIESIAERIANNTNKGGDLDGTDLMAQISDFFNPDKFPGGILANP